MVPFHAVETVGVPRETPPGERRVALTPSVVAALAKADLRVLVESGAGAEAGYPDEAYRDKGATIVASRDEAFAADAVLQVRTAGAAPESGRDDLGRMRGDKIVIGFANALAAPEILREVADSGATVFGMELMPRITRAQSMDALSSQASIAGYKGVLLMAETLPKMFPMMTTAAGTIAPARVLVIGAGVAGLQAIATARRLGAVVEGYDVRPEAKEQVESLGARFVELDIDTSEAQGEGGYAKEQSEEFLKAQRAAMAKVIAGNDAVITTALVPGKRAPVIVTKEMVEGMAPGSVVVDLAAEQGGNCEATVPGETVEVAGVTVVGTPNLPATVPHDASQMYAKNISTFLLHLAKEEPLVDLGDEITRETLVTHGGQIVHPRVRQAFGLEPLETPAVELEPAPASADATAAAAQDAAAATASEGDS